MMVVEELIDGREISFTGGAYRSATRNFLVYDSAGNDIDVANILPNYQLPDVGWMEIQGEEHPTLPGMNVSGASISAYADRSDAYLVSVKYEKFRLGTAPVDEVGFIETAFDISSEFRDVWRTAANVPSPSDAQAPSEEDIQGVAVDIKGEPISIVKTSMSITITHTIDYQPPLTLIESLSGKRNSSAWGIWSPGTILYEGASVTRVSHLLNRIVHSFHHDDQMHLRQVAVPDFTGSAALNSGTSATYALKAYPVIWRQPFPELASFTSLQLDESLPVT